ncbi:MAG: GTP-binding protein [Spirochaetaceae bacterium]|jgi:G3E family GTPase|nr:GTP-binding protein [Spirochaetaceae bacterium]
MSDKKVNLNIVAGFLGAGKTTLINKFLAEAFTGEKVAILENEMGEIGIDGDLLPAAMTVREILNGCICCTLQGDFIQGIKELVSVYQPDRIIIEPTGAGNLVDVINVCHDAEKQAPVRLETILTVVNAPLVLLYLEACGEFYKDQIRYSPLIVLSAVQKLGNKSPPLADIQKEIRKLNPHAPILTKNWDQMDSMEIITLAEEAASDINGASEPQHEHHHHHEEEGGFEAYSFIIQENWKMEDLKRFIVELRDRNYGEVFRAKGFIPFTDGFHKVDYVYGNDEIVASDYQGQGKFVVIGKGLNWEKLASCLK